MKHAFSVSWSRAGKKSSSFFWSGQTIRPSAKFSKLGNCNGLGVGNISLVFGIFVAGEGIKSSRVVLAGGEGAMFQGVLNTETIRKRKKDEPKGAAEKPEKPDDDDGDAKTERARLVTSSAEADRKPDIFDTHVGPFIESYVLWCQKKGVILGWIPGLVGAGAFIAVALVGGAGLGWLTGQGIIKCLDFFGYVDKIRMYLDAMDRA